ncbi:MAG: IS982 family transposase [Acidobacteria bacterium]|nr:IS982 family transposase [Acidobacteriota bacterium]
MKYQRLSNFKPKFTDQELMTIYLFGHLNGHYQKKAIYRFIKNYWFDWFPRLPSYQAFNRRLNLLEAGFHTFGAQLLEAFEGEQPAEACHLIDSVPVMLAHGSFARRARVAREIANTGYCAAKRVHFHGVRLHFIARRRAKQLPLPAQVWLREGSCHDLTSVKEQEIQLPDTALFGDKAFCDRALKKQLEQQNTRLYVPQKKPKGKHLSEFDKKQNRLISKIRQPIESLFKWLIDKTQIQRASQVRSTNGLLIHCFGKLTFALLLLVFYY